MAQVSEKQKGKFSYYITWELCNKMTNMSRKITWKNRLHFIMTVMFYIVLEFLPHLEDVTRSQGYSLRNWEGRDPGNEVGVSLV